MIRVIGGDFKKNGSAKLIRRKGEVAALEVPVSFMKNKLYVPKNIRSIMEETHLGRSIVLNISFSDDRYALLRVSGREAEEIINLGVTVERAVSEPNSEESDI
ncbi:hypothetical protein [uncultured Sneathiella sp.]|jgi:hypothetical protein|uniref:hypothetical protein n=1 Tax=uncultured Sneathiella sp. TaxID=879315 RepID=UPI002595F992|nr:hypothetical protein [uncultured Sneathiella sp.]